MKQSVLNILRIAMIALFVGYYASATLFVHTHEFEWGRITHSHPYAPSGTHSHSAAACQTIAELTNLLFVANAAIVVAACLAREVEYGLSEVLLWRVASVSNPMLRAPPVAY